MGNRQEGIVKYVIIWKWRRVFMQVNDVLVLFGSPGDTPVKTCLVICFYLTKRRFSKKQCQWGNLNKYIILNKLWGFINLIKSFHKSINSIK